ncbi:tRNA nucleotidyltransferase (CCA-adding enzyme) [Paraperlucidibaca baekdonensis]|uniref:Multifunctional CCA protein n=1 Tax=Paraperlucidibaca baekdonensis TaxID=748120 RepID=A0A3E0H9F2_9GAMM|nr:multifunctional CCA addition/repair protein [Paraperlucidibaca baekdonensis]REH40348.1 tRNA nucleotidyltransferase (CCA-adding enzyme) [Paraperlucidibaca baekdonensis]
MSPRIYEVGGAVRDALLGLPVHDIDYVVVGATPDWLLTQGYRQVGQDFPVFLHPNTQAEYALARTERKRGSGYHGFICDFHPEVTLEADLERRDLTINAMAKGDDGAIIDPYGGQRDLRAKVLRHVSPAFAEDPLRVLRVARFAARFAPLGFRIADDTLALMHQLSGELATLTPERIWQETERALMSTDPATYVQVLRDCGALKVCFPEVDALFGVPQRADFHPEIDTGLHTLMALTQAAKLHASSAVRFAVLVHDLGKAITPATLLPRHSGHEVRGLPLIDALSARLKVPAAHQTLARLVGEFHLDCHRATSHTPEAILTRLTRLDVWRRPERFVEFLTACEADARGRAGFEQTPYWQRDFWQQAAAVCHIDNAALLAQGYRGAQMAEAIYGQRLQRLTDFLRDWQKAHD